MTKLYRGFTIVELLVVIVVISILVTITIVGYGAWQKRVALTSVKSDLTQGYSAMKTKSNFSNQYYSSSSELAENFKPSQENVITVVPSSGASLPVYKELSSVQNGVLFYTICGDLVSEGYGRGTNNGGQMEQYISACNVYNKNQLQVNSSWTPQNFSTSVSSTALTDLAQSINYVDSWRPNRTQIEKDFYNTWASRFVTEGGAYPITSFWDAWANGGNGGVMKDPLPAPDSYNGASTGDFCIEAFNSRYPTDVMHITSASTRPIVGSC